MITNSEFLKLLSATIRVAKPFHSETIKDIEDIDIKFVDTVLDSLDMLMIGIYLSETFGVPEEIAKEMKPTTPREMYEFLQKHKTKEVTDVDKAIAELK